jgi:hypothetical protein
MVGHDIIITPSTTGYMLRCSCGVIKSIDFEKDKELERTLRVKKIKDAISKHNEEVRKLER